MIKCQWSFYPSREDKRNALDLLMKARSESYVLWATIFYEMSHKRYKFSNWVNNENWDQVKKAIEFANRDIKIYDLSEGLNF